jgi:hypothetical protein
MTPSNGAGSARASFEVIAESIPHLVWLADGSGSTDYFNLSRARLRQRLGVRTRAGLVRFARDAGLMEPGG